jgi:methylenetetrahydrofolate reductase (NADPH)
MLRVLQTDLANPEHFVFTLELVPGRESTGRSVDTVMGIARAAFADGRISAVSITDNPGGNPSLSPDVVGSEIFKLGMDVIVHFTCRDMNRVGMESRALQLAMMGMKNILALSGDYIGQGFGGQAAPVFDLDSVHLQIMLALLSERIQAAGDPDGFFSGCAVSPFKYTHGESFAQYAKLCRKMAAGAQFVITQLGYDALKFAELILMMDHLGTSIPAIGSVYVLTPGSARIMNARKVPGAVVSNQLRAQVEFEWRNKADGRRASIERSARLAAVLRGLGYRGVHIGGIHRNFETVGHILDRFEVIKDQWEEFLPQFAFGPEDGFYAFGKWPGEKPAAPRFGRRPPNFELLERLRYVFLKGMHDLFFNRDHALASFYARLSRYLDRPLGTRIIMDLMEGPAKQFLLKCQHCGDCAIQHVGFLCPESGCPKHTRNGACGGSRNGRCEVFSDRPCVWFRAYRRLAIADHRDDMVQGCVPPRMWELNQTSSWINYHTMRDHQGSTNVLAQRCKTRECRLVPKQA